MELGFKAIGEKIKIARIKKNLTQDKIGVSLPTSVAIANVLTDIASKL